MDSPPYEIKIRLEPKKWIRAAGKTASSGAKTVGKAAGQGIKAAGKASKTVTKAIDKVPVVGRPLSLVYGVTVGSKIELAQSIASGARIDKAVISNFKGQLSRAKQLAPYVQTVVSFVPGVGQGVSAAIGAGVALAEGRPLSAAVVEGIKGALPGGPAARAAFELGQAALSGQKIDASLLVRVGGGALELSPTQMKALEQGIGAARDIAQGKRVDQVVFQRAQQVLPPDAQKALQVGIAVAQGQNLQKTVTAAVGPAALARLQKIGGEVTAKSPVLAAGARVLRDPAQRSGYTIAAGLVAHKTTPIDLKAVRAKLQPSQKRGFDLAVAAYRGLASSKVAPAAPNLSAATRFGYYATAGLTSVPKKRRPAVATAIASNPVVQQGAVVAVQQQPQRVDPVVQQIVKHEDPAGFDGLFAAAQGPTPAPTPERDFFDDMLGP